MIRAQTKVSTTGSERKDFFIFQGHIVKGESTGLGKILRVVGEKNDYKMIDVFF